MSLGTPVVFIDTHFLLPTFNSIMIAHLVEEEKMAAVGVYLWKQIANKASYTI